MATTCTTAKVPGGSDGRRMVAVARHHRAWPTTRKYRRRRIGHRPKGKRGSLDLKSPCSLAGQRPIMIRAAAASQPNRFQTGDLDSPDFGPLFQLIPAELARKFVSHL